jgi:hypothetical protein
MEEHPLSGRSHRSAKSFKINTCVTIENKSLKALYNPHLEEIWGGYSNSTN